MAAATFTRFLGPSGRRALIPTGAKGNGTYAMRAAAVLTTSYVASSHMRTGATRSCGIRLAISDAVDYTSIEVIVEGAIVDDPASTDWEVMPADSTSIERSYTLADLPASTNRAIFIPIDTSCGVRAVRFWIKRTGGSAAGTVTGTGIGGV